jgi:hypothetical protein
MVNLFKIDKEEVINLSSLSINGLCLPTFQKAILHTKGNIFKKVKTIICNHYPNCNPLEDNLTEIKIIIK